MHLHTTGSSTSNLVQIINGPPTSFLDSEVTWNEVVREALWHVDRDSTHKGQIAWAILGVHNIHHLLEDRLIGNLCKLYHRVLCCLDTIDLGSDCVAHPGLLHVHIHVVLNATRQDL